MRIAIGALAGCVWLLSCGGGGGGGGGGGHEDAGVVIDAAVALAGTLSIGAPPGIGLIDATDPAMIKPAEIKLTATLTTPDGKQYDVSKPARFSIDPAYGSFTDNMLHMIRGGRTTVTGSYGGQLANAEVVARTKVVRVDPALGSTREQLEVLFSAKEDLSARPQVLYPVVALPTSNLVMPRNLGDFEIHWNDAHGHDLFEISLSGEFGDVVAYVPGGNGLAARGPMSSWSKFLPREWEVAVQQASSVKFRVRGLNRSAPTLVGTGEEYPVRLSNEEMKGALYYWANATTETKIGIFRHDMSKPGQPVEEYLTTAKTGDRCIACHVLSRDGKMMAITYQDKRADGTLLPPGPATTVDVAKATITGQTKFWNFATFTPDNSQLLAVKDGVLFVRDAATHAELAKMTTTPVPSLSDRVTHPDLSPDGKQLVYVRIGLTNTDFDFKAGQIFKRSYDPVTRQFGDEVAVVNDGKNNFYPSWSPDGAWILFNRNEFGNAYDDSQTSVWVIKADGTVPIELAKANQALGLTNSWARWAPFVQIEGAGKDPLYWITFSSKRDFGVRLINTGLAQRGGKRAQLWMSPFFPGLAAQGQDPSLPVFRFPFQNLASSNHIGQWAQQLTGGIL